MNIWLKEIVENETKLLYPLLNILDLYINPQDWPEDLAVEDLKSVLANMAMYITVALRTGRPINTTKDEFIQLTPELTESWMTIWRLYRKVSQSISELKSNQRIHIDFGTMVSTSSKTDYKLHHPEFYQILTHFITYGFVKLTPVVSEEVVVNVRGTTVTEYTLSITIEGCHHEESYDLRGMLLHNCMGIYSHQGTTLALTPNAQRLSITLTNQNMLQSKYTIA